MKKIILVLGIFMMISIFTFGGCKSCSCKKDDGPKNEGVLAEGIAPIVLESVERAENIKEFADQGNDNQPHADGIALSENFSVTLGEAVLPCYCVPTTYGLHSYAMADVGEEQFPLTVTLTVGFDFGKAEVLPEMRGVTAQKDGDKVVFTVSKYGDYTVVFDGGHLNAFSVFIRKAERIEDLGEEYDGYKVIEYERGIHYVDSIDIAESNTILYLHSGALLIAKQPTVASETPTLNPDWAGKIRWKSFITASYVDNVKIMGHGVIDFTNLDWHARSPVTVTGCKNFEMSGITLINAPEWNVTVQYSKDVYIHDMVIFGYRQNSDGIAICDTENALIENCFIRSGDDLFEVKSLNRGSDTGGKNITFRGCTAWADKCRGFGIIVETKNDISDVLYEDCAMLFKMQDWSQELGSIVVIVSDEGAISNITFRRMEVYYEKGYAINLSLGPNEWSTGSIVGKINNVTLEDIRLRQNNRVRIRTLDEVPAEDFNGFHFKNITYGGNKVNSFADLSMTYLGNRGSDITIE